MIKTVHPQFDGKWFVKLRNGRMIEAASLRLLQSHLGNDYELIGYYPKGYNGVMKWPNEPSRNVKHGSHFTGPAEPIKQQEQKPVPFAYDREAILDLWALGHEAPEIAKQLNIPRWLTVGDIVCRARHRGDPRAVSRTHNPNWRPPC